MITTATREENLKKLNAEFEKLSDEELEKVAGGLAKELELGRHPQPTPQQIGLE